MSVRPYPPYVIVVGDPIGGFEFIGPFYVDVVKLREIAKKHYPRREHWVTHLWRDEEEWADAIAHED